MVYFIFDNPGNKSKMEFFSNYSTREFKQVYPEHKLTSTKEMARFVWDTVSKSESDDKLIFWYDFMGVLCWWICALSFQKRNIIILNILLKDKNSIKNKLAKYLYRCAFLNGNTKATVTSKEYGNWINNLLDIRKEFYLLHDIYYGDAIGTPQNTEPYIFCGGKNGRDWKMYFAIANRMPRLRFLAILSQKDFEEIRNNIPQNVEIKIEIPEPEFIDAIAKSALVAIPLDTQAPAGLIVIFQAASLKKCVITSDTVTTREYIDSEKGVLCTDLDSWVKSIGYLIQNTDEVASKAENFNHYLSQTCATETYANRLYEIVRD